MVNFSEVRTLDKFQGLIDQCKLKGFNWKGDKVFTYSNNKTVSMSCLTHRLDQIYRSEYFTGALLSEQDCKKLEEIKDKFKKLDKQSIKVSQFQRCYLKIIRIVKFIFSFGGVDKKETLLKKIAIRATMPNEAIFFRKIIKTDLSPQVRDSLIYTYDKFYSKPFKDTHIRKREAVRTVQGKKIHRYNHGQAHSARKAFYIPFVIDYLLRHGLDHLSNKLQKLIDEEGVDAVIQKLQIAIIFEVARRESECGSRDNLEIYKSYLEKSAKSFIEYCEEKELIGAGKLFKNQKDVENYAEAIKNKYYNRFNGTKMDVSTVILDMAHTLDEFRCYWPSRMKDELEEINYYYTKDKNNRDLWQLSKFCEKAARVTGDRQLTEFSNQLRQRKPDFAFGDIRSYFFRSSSFTNGNSFINCSTDANYCWELLKKIRPPVSFSRGETTFSHLLPITKQANTQPLENPSNKSHEALGLIFKGKAAIRLVDTNPNKFGFEMKMLNDPVFFRPVESKKVKQEKEPKKKRLSLEAQMRNFDPNQSTSTSDNTKSKPVHQDKDRGLPKFTEDTKKLSFSLLSADGTTTYLSANKRKSNHAVGFLYDVERLSQKNQKLVFNKLLNNEVKICAKKSAIKALFALKDTPQKRVQAFLHTVYLAQDYGVHVPTLIIDGVNKPKAYKKEDLKKDLKMLYSQSGASSKAVLKELYSCFFSAMDKTKNEKLHKLLYDKCAELFVS